MATTLFISPHLDDVVFSCAGAVQRAVARGDRVIIATVFSHGRSHAGRRDEDQRAAELLGAEALWLGFEDAPDRSSQYRDFESIIFGRAAEDEALPEAVARELEEVIRAQGASVVHVPLGVGTHTDHRICFEAMQRIESTAPFWYYEDRPYCYATGAAELRLRELGLDAGMIDEARLLRGFRGLPHVRSYLPAGAARKRCEALLLMPLQIRTTRPVQPVVMLRCEAAETRKAHHAAEMHHSQFAGFCGSRRALQRRDARHANELGPGFSCPRLERYWTLSANPITYPYP